MGAGVKFPTVGDSREESGEVPGRSAIDGRYREFFDASSDALFVHDDQGLVVDVNQQACALFGAERAAELLGPEVGRLSAGVAPYGPAEAAAAVARAVTVGPQTFEWKSRRLTGELFWSEITLRATMLDGRRWIISSVRDISARKQAEEALRDSEDRYRALASIATEGLMLHEGGAIVDANQSFARLVGAPSPEGLIGRPGASVIPVTPASRQVLLERVRAPSDEPFDLELEFPDGRRVMVETRGRSTTYRGRAVRLVTMADVTQRRQAEAAAHEVSRRLALALTATADAVWEWNLVTGKTYYSPRWYQMLGYADQAFEMTYEVWRELCHPDDRQPTIERIQATLETVGSTGYALEFRMKAADGAWRWVLGRGNVVDRDAAGKPRLLAGTNSDISERKQAELERARLEERLRQAQKMESIGRLAGGVAHDFNNLLTTIGGNMALVLNDLAENDPRRELLLDAQAAANSAADLTRQLLAFSRKQVIDPRVLSLNDTVKRVEKMLLRILGEDITIQSMLAPDLGSVKIDPAQLEQVILNLCVNARDAMPEGGRLTLETGNHAFDADYCSRHPHVVPGEMVMLAVSDNGAGMTPEVLARLFEPFFTTKPSGKGTGLGLATVQGTVEQHGGRVEVYSEPGHGTTFKVYLPRAAEAPDVVRPTAPPAVPTGTECIVVVEDQPALRSLAVRLLQRQGYRVHAFPSGAAALAALPTLDAALIFTDVVMPDMNGKTLAERARALRPELKVLFTSGYTDNVVVHHGVLDAGVEFIPKPYSLQLLATRVREVLDRREPP
jgi:PAS domain S-box-containing protein